MRTTTGRSHFRFWIAGIVVLLAASLTRLASIAGNAPAPAAVSIPAPAPAVIDVWPGLAPGETTSNLGRVTPGTELLVTGITHPQLFVYPLTDGKPHPAILVLPGGAYQLLAADKEGTEIARWLNAQGFTAAVLYYRVPNDRDGAYQDGQRALSLLRAHAKDYNLDPKRVGVIGFSAGGHLAARLSAHLVPRAYTPIDQTDKERDVPDFTLLIYPAYLTLGGQGTADTVAEVQPHKGMPPTFLMQTQDDPYLDAPDYAKELEAARVKTELHLYATGGHGYGLRAAALEPVHGWAEAAAGWLVQFARMK